MKNFYAILFSIILASHVQAQECSGDQAVASFICTTTTQNPDIRLYISEFQTCENEKITKLDRSVLGMSVISQSSLDDIHTIGAENISINYVDKRILIDAGNRADYLSFLMPTDVTMIDGKTIIEMKVTDVMEPDYEGSDQFHFKGTFKMLTKGSLPQEGKLFCFVYR